MVKYLICLAAMVPTLSAAGKNYGREEVARHKNSSDCWLIIETSVYDVSGYIERHRDFEYDIARHCGADASALWQKKPGTGDSHSRKAEQLLKKYHIGKVAE